jgi:hypothetical protein
VCLFCFVLTRSCYHYAGDVVLLWSSSVYHYFVKMPESNAMTASNEVDLKLFVIGTVLRQLIYQSTRHHLSYAFENAILYCGVVRIVWNRSNSQASECDVWRSFNCILLYHELSLCLYMCYNVYIYLNRYIICINCV